MTNIEHKRIRAEASAGSSEQSERQRISKFEVSNVWKISVCSFQCLGKLIPSTFNIPCSIFFGSSEMEGI